MLDNSSKYIIYKARASQCNEEMIQAGFFGYSWADIHFIHLLSIIDGGLLILTNFKHDRKKTKPVS